MPRFMRCGRDNLTSQPFVTVDQAELKYDKTAVELKNADCSAAEIESHPGIRLQGPASPL
jgi:hypothetical protein